MYAEALTPNQILIKTLKANKPLSITHGKYHPVLQALSQRHSEAQASRDWHGGYYRGYAHSGWNERHIELIARVPEGKNFAEVCAWAGPHAGPEKAAEAIFAAWKSSPDHWVFVNGYVDFWGYTLSQSRSGIWYSTGILAQKR
jgi:hypothetical protein